MHGRHPTISDGDTEALYHPVPQAPVPAVPPRPSLEISSDEEGDADIVDPPAHVHVPAGIDARIRWIHFVLGNAVLLPWNAMITATPYFMSRLEGSSLKSSFGSYLSTTFMIANFSVLAYATATAKQSSSARRVIVSLTCLALLTASLTLSTWAYPSPGLFFAFVIINGMLQATAGSFLQTSVIAVASLFGHTAMQATMSGQAAVGVVVSGIQVLSAAASTQLPMSVSVSAEPVASTVRTPEEKSAALFFGLSTVFLLFTEGVQTWMVTLPAYKALVAKARPRSHSRRSTSVHAELADETRALTSEGQARTRHTGKNRVWRLARANLAYNFAVAYVFIITLSVFPAITVSIQSTNPHAQPLLFSAVHFLIYNIGDFAGRSLCSLPRLLIWDAKRLLTFSLLRTLFVPLFLLCNIQWAGPSALAPVIASDALYMLLLLLFGLSNGYVSSMCMMSAPSVAHNPALRGRTDDVDVAATVASFCLVGGLTLGSFASFAVRAAVCSCNPFTQ